MKSIGIKYSEVVILVIVFVNVKFKVVVLNVWFPTVVPFNGFQTVLLFSVWFPAVVVFNV